MCGSYAVKGNQVVDKQENLSVEQEDRLISLVRSAHSEEDVLLLDVTRTYLRKFSCIFISGCTKQKQVIFLSKKNTFKKAKMILI